ncbi:hypothetical protein K440DRAFT_586731 [Wilcoxina mikolae CBS 423.85]|nr:hypothetical protein K440DRAFT_586731 [Wilcoxina mikolae CBS 423.85]
MTHHPTPRDQHLISSNNIAMDAFVLTPRPPGNRDGEAEQPLLTAVSSSGLPALPPAPANTACSTSVTPASLTSAPEILDALRSGPSQDTVVQSLHLLDTQFDCRVPSAISSQITKVLLETTLPDFWHVLSKQERALLAKCLASPTGLGGITARLKALTPLARDREGAEAQTCRENLGNVLVLLQMVLGRKGFIYEIWTLVETEPETKRHILWREFTALVAGGRLLSVAAEAESVLGRLSNGQQERWVGDGKMFALWLGREIATASLRIDLMEDTGWKSLSLLLTASFRLGYSDNVVEGLTYKLVNPKDESQRLQKLISLLPAHDKRSYMVSLLRVISLQHFQTTYQEDDDTWWKHDATKVSSAAALLEKFILHDDDFRSLILEWLTSTTGGGVGEPLALRRSIMAVVAQDELAFRELFEKLLQQFADKLWINHTPIMRQEVNVQILLLCAGHSHRHSPSFLARLTKSSNFLSGVSNRLATSSHRARFLGMIIGESFSALVDKDAKMKMSFDTEETQTDEAKWWKAIPSINDQIGSLKDLFATSTAMVPKKRKPPRKSISEPPATAGIQVVEEDLDSDSDEFTPYALPDSDPEDAEDEDATTIDRNKPSPPVYIRTLLSYFHSTDNYDRQHLALLHAAPLIRRKAASGGKEVSSHLEELASALAGIDDRFDMPDFSDLRNAGLVALVVAEPVRMGQWLARQFFVGDYGLSQRATLLVAIGLGARELACLDPPPSLPQKQLPGKISTVWSSSSPSSQISSITTALKQTYLTPLAASAADQATGPNILKIRTFSSRMAVESRRPPPKHRKILDLVAPAFFFPLTGGWVVTNRDVPNPPHADPHILVLFLNTLSVLIHAAGPGTPALQEMTGEFLELLLSLRRVAEGDGSVCEAVLLGVLTVLEVNLEVERGQRLAEREGGKVVEVREWVEGVFEGAWGAEEGVRALAAGVLVKIQEVAEGWRRALMGGLGVEE